MKIELFLGRRDVRHVNYARGFSRPLVMGGRACQWVFNLRWIAIFIHR